MILQYWFMLPAAILIATTAMALGIGGATFFSPFFIERGLGVLFILVAVLALGEAVP